MATRAQYRRLRRNVKRLYSVANCWRSIGLRLISFSLLFALPLLTAFDAFGETIALTKSGPKTVRELASIEYRIEAVNESASPVDMGRVLDKLPAEIDFTEAIVTPGGIYDPVSGIWELPSLGIGEEDSTAELRLRGLVQANLLSQPTDVVTIVNQATVVTPEPPDPVNVEVATNVVCSFCIDWQIVAAELDMDTRTLIAEDPPFEVRFFLRVRVGNNGPVPSEGVLESTDFAVGGGGLDRSLTLQPTSPVSVFLDPGEEEVITFSTDWTEGPDDDYTVSWTFEIRDASLLDPVEPNTESGSFFGEVENGDNGGGGCFIATAAYGSYLDPHVGSLRRFRDEVLMRSRVGRTFVSWYYDVSPPIARHIEESESLKAITRTMLAPVVVGIDHPRLALFLLGALSVGFMFLRRLIARRRTHGLKEDTLP